MLNPTLPKPRLSRLRQFVYQLRNEGNTPGRHAVAVGVGVFIGCTPFYGFHLPLSYVTALMLGVSRLTVYLAANISNPFVLPLLVLSEVQVGALLMRGHLHALTMQAVRATDPWSFGLDLVVGAAVVGTVLGGTAAVLTYTALRGSLRAGPFNDVVLAAADHYLASSITAWEFARAKLRSDPVYRDALLGGVLPSGGVLVDVGCGQGLMLTLLIEAARRDRAGTWPVDQPAPPVFSQLIGLEPRPRVAHLAREATAGAALVVEGDARTFAYPPCDAMLFLDVLQMMPPSDQESVLGHARRQLAPGGVILVREADASAGRRFLMVRVGNRLKALVTGAWRQPLCYRRSDEWLAVFNRLGFEAVPCRSGAPGRFGNVLFRLTPVRGCPRLRDDGRIGPTE